jgi:23S rRNA (uracil1939-C5)-methyltransferase
MDEINFKIQHLDPMGQGVYKEGDQIYFIPKTLPEEEGSGEIYKKSKGVNFVRRPQVHKASAVRVSANCPHYDSCPGCHYLHTDYKNEIEFKKKSLERTFSGLGSFKGEIQVKKAKRRDRYRNRVQLHYDLAQNKLGFIDVANGGILEIPSCKIASAQVSEKIEALYENQSWRKEAEKQKHPKGHVEIYNDKDYWNESYAQGGFTQVNQEMNLEIKAIIADFYTKISPKIVLDLYGGSGNLSKEMKTAQVVVVDTIIDKKMLAPHQKALVHNLGKGCDYQLIQQEMNFAPEYVLINPPRGGLNENEKLLQFLKNAKNPPLTYVSCNPMTLVRDLKILQDQYDLDKVFLVDLFPSTFHFETVVHLKKKNGK